ncbi:MAG: RsmE family RNA methyltransferase [Vicinamibacterales bacterium]
MSALPRFLADAIDAAGGTAHLPSDEARHLSQVLRLGSGDEIAVFDGAGKEFRARVDRVFRDGADVRLIEPAVAAPEPSIPIVVAQAALKGDKMDDVIRDATMMGAVAIEPLITEHTVAHLVPGGAPERWRRIAVASAKQCGRAIVPRIGRGRTLGSWLDDDRAELRLILVEPIADASARLAADLAAAPPRSAALLVGPEGGWSTGEIECALRAGYVAVTLGRRTLRADAVPIVAMGVMQAIWRDL